MPGKFEAQEQQPSGWRMAIALTLICLSFGSAAFVPLVTASGLSSELKTALSGLLIFGIPQLLMLIAVGLVGKSGMLYLKQKIVGRMKALLFPSRVSNLRYRTGLALFLLPLLAALLGPYLEALLPILSSQRTVVSLAGDIMFISGLILLGSDFWDKLRALVDPNARAHFPDKDEARAP